MNCSATNEAGNNAGGHNSNDVEAPKLNTSGGSRVVLKELNSNDNVLTPLTTKSASLKLSPSPRSKETPTTALTSTTPSMAPAANTPATEENSRIVNKPQTDSRPKAGIFDGLPLELGLSGNSGVNTACTKFVGLTEYDESSIPELPGNLNPNIGEHLQLTFEDGLIPTFTANINQEQQFNSFMHEDDTNEKAQQQLLAVNETDTAVSSDSEIFAECQSYQDGAISTNTDHTPDEFSINSSSMDCFFSAANSRNTTITNIDTDPLSITVGAPTTEEEAVNAESTVITPTSVENPENTTQLNADPVIRSFEDEPMDVDVSFTQEQLLQNDTFSGDSLSPRIMDNAADFPAEIITTAPDCTNNKPANNVESKVAESTTPTNSPEEVNNVAKKSPLASIDSELEVEQSKHEVSMNKSIELPTQQQSHNNSISECVIQDNSIDSSANDDNDTVRLRTDAIDVTHNITTASDASPNAHVDTLAEKGKEATPTKAVDVLQTETTVTTKSSPESVSKVNVTTDMNTSTSSSKSSTSSLTSFPIKQNPNDIKQFPRSPTKVVEKEMTYLEKSEYTERKEIERKKSIAAELRSTQITPPKNMEHEMASTATTTTTELNNTIDVCTPKSNKTSAELSNTSEAIAELNSTYNESVPSTTICIPDSVNIPAVDHGDVLPDSANIVVVDNSDIIADNHNIDRKAEDNIDSKRRTFNIGLPLPESAHTDTNEVSEMRCILPAKLDDLKPEARRTFTISAPPKATDSNDSLEKQRTFNVSPSEKEVEVEEDEGFEPMDVDDTLPLPASISSETPTTSTRPVDKKSDAVVASPPVPALMHRQRDEETVEPSLPSSTISTSPPVPTSMHHQKEAGTLEASPPSSTISTSPPVPSVMSRRKNDKTLTASTLSPMATSPPVGTLLNKQGSEEALMLPPLSTVNPISPPLPALLSRENNAAALSSTRSISPPLPTLQKGKKDEAALMMPPPPPPPLTARSPPIPTLQKRPPIHGSCNDPFGKMESPERLSAKEQTKCNSSDEKDVFAGNCTPSPMDEAPPNTFSRFGNTRADADSQEFSDAEFQSGNNLILNPSDFDYLLTKGNNNVPVDRSSILLKFDPLLGVPVAVNQPQPTKQAQQILQQLLGNNAPCLSPTLEEDEVSASTSSNSNSQSFLVESEQKNRSFETNSATKSAKLTKKNSAELAKEFAQAENEPPQQAEEEHIREAANTKKHARMSVDVIKDMNVDNDCNKSFENSNLQSDEKKNNYKMGELEKKIKNEVLKTEDIEKKLEEAEQREETLIKRITEKDKTITKMNGVIEAYEKAIAELIAEKEQLTQNYEKQLNEIKADRDSNYQHLTSLETTFSDLHVKYEKSKEMTLQLKSNEEGLLTEKRQILENLRLQEQRYDKMKNHAMQQLEIANKKLEALNKEHSVETTKLKALLKKEEISRASINEQLQQKSRENAELVKICDELINGQGS